MQVLVMTTIYFSTYPHSYDTANNQWSSETNFAGVERVLTFSFNINNKGYIGFGF